MYWNEQFNADQNTAGGKLYVNGNDRELQNHRVIIHRTFEEVTMAFLLKIQPMAFNMYNAVP